MVQIVWTNVQQDSSQTLKNISAKDVSLVVKSVMKWIREYALIVNMA